VKLKKGLEHHKKYRIPVFPGQSALMIKCGNLAFLPNGMNFKKSNSSFYFMYDNE
jgi:hypothetical protein